MTTDLPPAIGAYFSAVNARDYDRAAAQFTPSAHVHDEQADHDGRPAVREWIERTVEAYDFRAEPSSVRDDADGVRVEAEVSGTFPNSPITLGYRFVLEDGLIARLEIG